MEKLAQVSAVIAFLLCLIGGAWIINHSEDTMWIGIGLYFMARRSSSA